MYQYKETGLDNVWLANGYTVKETPYGDAVHVESADALDGVIAQTLIQSEEPLSGQAFRFLRQQLGMNQPDVGTFMAVDAQTIARWEKGTTAIPLTADFVMRALYASYVQRDTKIDSMVETMKAVDKAKHSRIILNNQANAWTGTEEPYGG